MFDRHREIRRSNIVRRIALYFAAAVSRELMMSLSARIDDFIGAPTRRCGFLCRAAGRPESSGAEHRSARRGWSSRGTSRFTAWAERVVAAARPYRLSRFIDGLPSCHLFLSSGNRSAPAGWRVWVDRRIFKRGGRMRADRREALLDFLLDAVADEGITAFPVHVLAGLRRVVRCAQAAY